MARTPSVTAGAAHASGFTAASMEHKLLHELYEVLEHIDWSPEAAKSAIDDGGLNDVDCFVNLKETDVCKIVKISHTAGVMVGAMKKLYLHLLCWVARHHVHIGHEIIWTDVRTD